MVHRRESATRKRRPSLQKTPTTPTPESDFKKVITPSPSHQKSDASLSPGSTAQNSLSKNSSILKHNAAFKASPASAPMAKPQQDSGPLRLASDFWKKPSFQVPSVEFLNNNIFGQRLALAGNGPRALFAQSKTGAAQTKPMQFLQTDDRNHISDEHTKPGAAAPTARVVNPLMSAFGLTTLFSNWYNRKIDHYRVGDNRAFLKGWGKTPANARKMGHGPDIIGTVTDVIGLGLNELGYLPQIRAKIADAEQKGDEAGAEKWKRSLFYGRLNTFGTLASLAPTLRPGDHRYYGSRFLRMPLAVAKSAIMLDGIQQDYKNGLLNKRDAAAYSFSGAIRAGIAGGRLLIINNRLRKYTDKINNIAYDIDMGASAIENVFISWSGLVRGQTQPVDAWAEIYRRVAPEGADDTMLAISGGVNNAMDTIGMHDKNSALRKKLSYLTGDWRSLLP